MTHAVLAGFSGHGSSIHNIIPLFKNVHPFFQFIFGVARIWVGLSLKCAPHIKGIAIWRVGRTDIGVIRLQKFSYVNYWVLFLVWHSVVLLPDVESSISHPLNPNKHYLFETLDIGFRVEPSGAMNGSITLLLLMTILNNIMWIGCLVFINMRMNLSTD